MWKIIDNTVLYYEPSELHKLKDKHVQGQHRILAFELDDTLVKCKSGASLPRGRSDWDWHSPSVATKLKQMYENGYQIVIFTNQKLSLPVAQESMKLQQLKGSIERIHQQIGVPMCALVATAHDQHRKPDVGLFEVYSRCRGLVDVDHSIMVSGHAGRTNDVSDMDISFADSIGVQLITPEEFFPETSPNLNSHVRRLLSPSQLSRATQSRGELRRTLFQDSSEAVFH